jgi:predicted NBD/HSP70 family sugar kinase
MLEDLIDRAEKKKLGMAPFIGIGCPGIIAEDGSIERGGQNLPENWESKGFNLPQLVRERIPTIAGHETVVVMHNDAVVQGLSEIPNMQDVEHRGVFTIGTGLGNACFTNKKRAED